MNKENSTVLNNEHTHTHTHTHTSTFEETQTQHSHTHTFMHYIYIYIYIEREREKGNDTVRNSLLPAMEGPRVMGHLIVYSFVLVYTYTHIHTHIRSMRSVLANSSLEAWIRYGPF